MACSTGEAWGLTLTRSAPSRWANHSAVMADTREAELAWWPPTLTPSPAPRSWLAESTMRVLNQSTRCAISSRTLVSGRECTRVTGEVVMPKGPTGGDRH